MKKQLSLRLAMLLIFLALVTVGRSKNVTFDQKYVTTGVFTNLYLPAFQSPNIRYYNQSNLSNHDLLNSQSNIGNVFLRRIFNCTNGGHPTIDGLYEQALQEVTQEEREIASKDVSSETSNILKNDIVRQILKNNYVVIVDKQYYLDKRGNIKTVKLGTYDEIWNKNGYRPGETKYYYEWAVYHIDIDDEVINQVFLNWDNPAAFCEIKVPITFVAKGKTKGKKEDRIVYQISRKVPAFAIRGPIIMNHPTIASTTKNQGVRTGDNFRVYRTYEDNNGKMHSRKVAEAIALTANSTQTKLSVIAGRYPKYKNGEIAALYGHGKSSISLQGQYSFGGDDPRAGGRITYEAMPKFTEKGISNYILVAVEYQQFKKEPNGVWFEEGDFSSKYLNPQLRSYGGLIGYGLGINFLTKFEITPYVLGGVSVFNLNGTNNGAYIWNSSEQEFNGINLELSYKKGITNLGLTVYGGIRLAYNLWYPLQLIIGAEYGATVIPDESYKNISDRHELCRLSIISGLRFNF